MAILVLQNNAFERAVGRMLMEGIEAEYRGEVLPNLREYHVSSSDPTKPPYTVHIWQENNNAWGKCNCAAHTGISEVTAQPEPDYIPKLCKHIAAAFCNEAQLVQVKGAQTHDAPH
jgi:hypothetical protein